MNYGLATLSDDEFPDALLFAVNTDQGDPLKCLLADPRFRSADFKLKELRTYKSILHLAVYRHSINAMAVILEAGINPDISDNGDETLLHYCMSVRDLDETRVLLEGGADPYRPDQNGNTAWHLAAERGFAEILEVLLSDKYDINKALQTRSSIGRTPLESAMRENQVNTSQLILDHIAPNSHLLQNDPPYLHLAAAVGSIELFDKLLGVEESFLRSKDNLTMVESMLTTAVPSSGACLDIAGSSVAALFRIMDICEGDLGDEAQGIIRMLVRAGADVHSRRNENCLSPTEAACVGRSWSIFQAIWKGADRTRVNDIGYRGQSLLHMTIENVEFHGERKMLYLHHRGVDVNLPTTAWPMNRPLHVAASNRRWDIVHFLIGLGANISLTNAHGTNILHLAVAQGNILWIKERWKHLSSKDLWDARCSVDVSFLGLGEELTTLHDGNALHIAAVVGCSEVIQFMKEQDLLTDINANTMGKATAPHLAVYGGNVEVIQLLLQYGADLHARDGEGLDPVQYASHLGRSEIVELLTYIGRDCIIN
ncbi:hypothetical protein EG329_001523 [Mollisiaceae sp. DMI_Dod_QoI]|nr:hypothetical protein EG329_001523 [Helotiales sp. DMI_Dod_QoI]